MVSIKIFKRTSGYIRQLAYGFHPLTREINPRINRRWVVNRSMVSNTWMYCCFRIPKCANSTIARSLAYYDPKILYDPSEDPHGKGAKNDSRRLLSAKALTVSNFCDRYYLFTFVRNPYSRLLSAYMDKIVRFDNLAFELTRKVVRKYSDTGHALTFEAFINYLEDCGLYKNPHWAPQTAMLPVAVEKVDFIGKVEKLEDDFGIVVNHLFGNGIYKGLILREINRTNSAAKLAQYYNKNLAERVYNLYKEDFESLSYAKDLP